LCGELGKPEKRGGVLRNGFVFVDGDDFFVATGGEDSGTKLAPSCMSKVRSNFSVFLCFRSRECLLLKMLGMLD
jgi:hypothetical protein